VKENQMIIKKRNEKSTKDTTKVKKDIKKLYALDTEFF